MDDSFGRKLLEKAKKLHRTEHPPWISDEEWPLPFIGCTPNEIEEIKSSQKVSKLPLVYEQFLAVMGKSSGDLFIGDDVHYHRLVVIKDFFIEELKFYKVSFCIPDDTFVCLSHHDIAFLYFLPEDLNDPEIYVFEEPRESEPHTLHYRHEMVKMRQTLSSFLTEFIAERESEAARKEFLQQFI